MAFGSTYINKHFLWSQYFLYLHPWKVFLSIFFFISTKIKYKFLVNPPVGMLVLSLKNSLILKQAKSSHFNPKTNAKTNICKNGE